MGGFQIQSKSILFDTDQILNLGHRFIYTLQKTINHLGAWKMDL